jgi:putative flippase GtrA
VPRLDTAVDALATLRSGRRLVQFGLVGVVGLAVDNAVLVGLVELAGWRPVAGAVISKELSILVMFAINERWTFATASDRDGPLLHRALRSNLARLGGLVVGVATLAALTTVGVWYVAANLVGIGLGFFVNYAAESLFTWRLHESEGDTDG